MRLRKPSQTGPRRVWRMTADAPQGEFVDPDHVPIKTPDLASAEDTSDATWRGSSYDLLQGLDVKESVADDLFDDLFEGPPPTAPEAKPISPPESCTPYQWILRFALRIAQLDTQAQPKLVIAMARELWRTTGHLMPEDVAVAKYDRDRQK